MEFDEFEESGLVVRIAAFDDLIDLTERIGEVREVGAIALYFDEGMAYEDSRIFVTPSGSFSIPFYVPEPGVLVSSLGLVTPRIDHPRFHAFDLDDQGQISIVGQSPIALSYERFTMMKEETVFERYVRSLRALRA